MTSLNTQTVGPQALEMTKSEKGFKVKVTTPSAVAVTPTPPFLFGSQCYTPCHPCLYKLKVQAYMFYKLTLYVLQSELWACWESSVYSGCGPDAICCLLCRTMSLIHTLCALLTIICLLLTHGQCCLFLDRVEP